MTQSLGDGCAVFIIWADEMLTGHFGLGTLRTQDTLDPKMWV